MLAIVVAYLYRFWEIGVGAEIWCENISESAQLFHIAIHVYPKCIELVVIKEKVNRFFFWLRAFPSDVVESYKFAFAFECLWVYLWYTVLAHTVEDAAI